MEIGNWEGKLEGTELMYESKCLVQTTNTRMFDLKSLLHESKSLLHGKYTFMC